MKETCIEHMAGGYCRLLHKKNAAGKFNKRTGKCFCGDDDYCSGYVPDPLETGLYVEGNKKP